MMSLYEKRIAIAQLRGWSLRNEAEGFVRYHSPTGKFCGNYYPNEVPESYDAVEGMPDYLSDLNAITSACREHITDKVKQAEFAENLIQILNRRFDGQHRFLGATPFHVATAEPDDLCSAFLLTMLP